MYRIGVLRGKLFEGSACALVPRFQFWVGAKKRIAVLLGLLFAQLGAVVRRGILSQGTMTHAEEQAEVDGFG